MKILFVHTFYAERGGEDAVFKNERKLLSEVAEVRELSFHNSGSGVSVAAKFMLAPWNFLAVRRFKKVAKEFKPDIVHIHNWYFAASPLIIRTAKKMGIKVVLTLHNYRLLCPSATLFNKGELFKDSLKESFPWTAIKKKVYRNSMLQTLWLASIIHLHKKLKTWQMVDKYVALTDFAKNIHLSSSLNLAVGQVVVKGNFVSDNGFAAEDRENHFLFVGRLTEDKGVKTLLKAFENSTYTLEIIGDGPLKSLVLETAKHNPNIVYQGPQPHYEIIKAMKKAAALLFPSIWYEGMPMTILEAFSCGTPVIASKLGAMESLIKHKENGLFFKPGDINELQLITKDWNNYSKEQKIKMAENARKTYEASFTPEQNLKELSAIYNSVKTQTFYSKYCNNNSDLTLKNSTTERV